MKQYQRNIIYLILSLAVASCITLYSAKNGSHIEIDTTNDEDVLDIDVKDTTSNFP